MYNCMVLQLQLYGYNAELYRNMSEAQHRAQGVVGVALMVQVSVFVREWSCGLHNCLGYFFLYIYII